VKGLNRLMGMQENLLFLFYYLFSVQLYMSCIIGCIFLNGGIPLFYELSCEASYPIAEGITGAFLTLLNNIFGVVFLLALQIPNIGKKSQRYIFTFIMLNMMSAQITP
jgi:hypothetical protein